MRALKINTWRALRALRFLGNSYAILSLISEKRKCWPLRDYEGPQKYNIKGPNDPWQFLLILTPGPDYEHLSIFVKMIIL